MRPAIFATPIEVDGRLSDFGITREQLEEVVHAMIAARAGCTDNDPPSASGWSAWRYGTRRIREILRPHGWQKEDTDLSAIVNHKLGMRIVVANTDDATGVISKDEEALKIARKRVQRQIVLSITIRSRCLMALLETSLTQRLYRSNPAKDILAPTLLSIFVFSERAITREQSCHVPSAWRMVFFVGFSERIIVIGRDGWVPAPKRKRDGDTKSGASEFDIPVRRK